MDEPRRVEFTDRDLAADYDEKKLDRVGKPIGVEQHDAGRPEQARESKTKESHTLQDMAKDFEFFTTGVIHAVTRFDRDPVAEFNKLKPADSAIEMPQIIDYAHPFFTGMGVGLIAGMPVNLDRRLYAIVRHRWDELRNVISGIAMIHRPTNFYARLNFYELEIVDPFALKKMTVVEKLPTVTITVFGVSSNKSLAYLQSAVFPTLPRLVTNPPDGSIAAEGLRVLGPPPSPENLLPKKS